jgi:hypothetical protein
VVDSLFCIDHPDQQLRSAEIDSDRLDGAQSKRRFCRESMRQY